MDERRPLVRGYFGGVGAFGDVRVVSEVEAGADPFYAVVARRANA